MNTGSFAKTHVIEIKRVNAFMGGQGNKKKEGDKK